MDAAASPMYATIIKSEGDFAFAQAPDKISRSQLCPKSQVYRTQNVSCQGDDKVVKRDGEMARDKGCVAWQQVWPVDKERCIRKGARLD